LWMPIQCVMYAYVTLPPTAMTVRAHVLKANPKEKKITTLDKETRGRRHISQAFLRFRLHLHIYLISVPSSIGPSFNSRAFIPKTDARKDNGS
jgi:hypothetical protein